jgi:hypothetical protein
MEVQAMRREMEMRIVDWIKNNDVGEYWLLDLFRYLVSRGATGEDALMAMSLFVDQAIARKARREMV